MHRALCLAALAVSFLQIPAANAQSVDWSRISQATRAWIESSCSIVHDAGPSVYYPCIQRNVEASQGPAARIDLGRLDSATRAWIESSCSIVHDAGPSVYYPCIQRNVGSLPGGTSFAALPPTGSSRRVSPPPTSTALPGCVLMSCATQESVLNRCAELYGGTPNYAPCVSAGMPATAPRITPSAQPPESVLNRCAELYGGTPNYAPCVSAGMPNTSTPQVPLGGQRPFDTRAEVLGVPPSTAQLPTDAYVPPTAAPQSPRPAVASASRPQPARTSTKSVPMQSEGGTYLVPVLINDTISLKFVVDSGAADVSIPADVVMTLMRTGTLRESDFLGKKTYILADGSKAPSDTFRIKSLKVGPNVIENVTGSVAPVNGSLLLGQSFLGRFKSWSIDNNKHVLMLEARDPVGPASGTLLTDEQVGFPAPH